MTNKRLLSIISILCCLILLTAAWPVLAQTPTPREALLEAIQARAQKDVELGKPPEGIAGLEILFGDEAATVGLSMAEVLDVYEAAYTAATPVEPWWTKLRPEAGWVVAILLFVLFILRDVLKDNLTKFVNWLWQRIYLQLAGFRPFWGIALRRYRRALVTRYEQLKIPFRPGRPLEMRKVYVPLKVSGIHDTDLIDAYHAVAEHKWLMVLGEPGSGKTMLLKRLALRYAEGDHANLSVRPVPVLLELNRLSGSTDPLETHLAKALEDNDFPGGEHFLKVGLEHGLLLLLLDGLDEVSRDARGHVVRQIKDLLGAHPAVRAMITCRTAVYDDDFADLIDQQLEIAPFSDQQIQRFLSTWARDMPPGKSAEQLACNLRERPHIMGLARNPLLLTIIAYLYTDTPFVLPHSRSAFYDKALTVLLEQWDQARGMHNRYTPDEKRLVLQHLALFFQQNSATLGRDRRSIDLPTALAEIKNILPSVNRQAEDARPMLDEIVERSGLLLALDGGLRYQFSHLTLQEFFVAQKLQDDANTLLEHYKADSDAWRETVKLWCGLAHDSTDLIRAIYASDPILAFECLGDAQQVDADFATDIITAFRLRLGEVGDEGEAVTRAFASVATNPQARGQQLFGFLATTVLDPITDQTCRLATAQALALSNLPQAVAVLVQCTQNHPNILPILVQMGDLATATLTEWASQSHEWALDGLQTVGTPDAVYALTDLLWSEDETLPYKAAWRLGGLLSNPNVEAALKEYPLTETQRNDNYLEWVWEPFDSEPTSVLWVVAGRIAHLMHTTPSIVLPIKTPKALDPRLLIPLCAISTSGENLKRIAGDYRDILGRLQAIEEMRLTGASLYNQLFSSSVVLDHSVSSTYSEVELTTEEDFIIADLLDRMAPNKTQRCLWQSLDTTLQNTLLQRLISATHIPTANDWRRIFDKNEYEFVKSWHAWGIKVALLLILGLNLWEILILILNAPPLLSWVNGGYVLSGLCILVIVGGQVLSALEINGLNRIVHYYILGLGLCTSILIGSSHRALVGGLVGTAVYLVSELAWGWPQGLLRVPRLGVTLGYALVGSLIGWLDHVLVGALVGICVGLLGLALGVRLGRIDGVELFRVGGGSPGLGYIKLSAKRLGQGSVPNIVSFTMVTAYGATQAGICGLFTYAISAFPTQLLYDLWGWLSVVLFWVICAVWVGVLWRIGVWNVRLTQNPLRGILEK
ncbi:MAG: NACHT domain-containing protein [Anaerolineae bacterium]|nr:NACHT domain-containing protein [Anaerolineae bacterium]